MEQALLPACRLAHGNVAARIGRWFGLLLLLFVRPGYAVAESGDNPFLEDLYAIRYEAGAALLGVTIQGVRTWNWGSSSFRLNPEGWFGEDTGAGGVDKLGHAFAGSALTNIFGDQLLDKGRSHDRAALNAFLTSQALMLYVEVFDGFSEDHGFSYEDLLMNLGGGLLGYARIRYPSVRDLVDYRMEYVPSGNVGFRPFSDYEGQKFLLALKFAGMESVSRTPLRYLELQAGYYARGFSKEEELKGASPARHVFLGLGLNLNRLFLGQKNPHESTKRRVGRLFFENIQVPGTAIRTEHEIQAH